MFLCTSQDTNVKKWARCTVIAPTSLPGVRSTIPIQGLSCSAATSIARYSLLSSVVGFHLTTKIHNSRAQPGPGFSAEQARGAATLASLGSEAQQDPEEWPKGHLSRTFHFSYLCSFRRQYLHYLRTLVSEIFLTQFLMYLTGCLEKDENSLNLC